MLVSASHVLSIRLELHQVNLSCEMLKQVQHDGQ